jgi:hypothetical protein
LKTTLFILQQTSMAHGSHTTHGTRAAGFLLNKEARTFPSPRLRQQIAKR